MSNAPTPPLPAQPPIDHNDPPGTAFGDDGSQDPLPKPRRQHHVPRQAGVVGMWLFLASLAMLFAASMVGYLIIRLTGSNAPPLGESQLTVPLSLWVSTALMLLSSLSIHRALVKVRREKLKATKTMLVVTSLLALGFVVLQGPALIQLLGDHQAAMEKDVFLFGLIFFLILLHAAHVLGGLIPLAVVTVKSFSNRYDHEYHGPILYTTMYWHFLDAVWVIMFVVFLVSA